MTKISDLDRKLIKKFCINNSNNVNYIINDEVVSIKIVYDAIKKTKKYKILFVYLICILKFIKLYRRIKK
jgi:hypothetical protein